jgi:translation initiation factor 4A
MDMNNAEEKEIKTWEDFNIKPELMRGIFAYGYEAPSEIQKKAIPHMILKNDMIGQAQSGTGKTATFGISTLQLIDVTQKTTQALIVSPTHELAKQTATVISKLGDYMDGLVVKTILGGTSIKHDADEMRENTPHIIVGCAGRIFDMIQRRYIDTSKIELFVLDEADELLSSGFKSQIQNIFTCLSNTKLQVAIFSATMPPEMLDITNKFMKSPVKITMKPEELTLECIKQEFIALENDHAKFDMIKELFSFISTNQSIIFCNSVNRVIDLYNAMTKEGFSVCAIHSAMSKLEREQTLKQFRTGTFRVLISSNVTARGIDVQQVSTVINFDIPKDFHTYLHRIGRSGRHGRKGNAVNFVTRYDVKLMQDIEKYFETNITEFKPV